MDIDDFVTAREAGEMLNIKKCRVAVLCREGRFEGAKKITLGWLIPRQSVKNFVRLAPGAKPKVPTREDEIKFRKKIIEELRKNER